MKMEAVMMSEPEVVLEVASKTMPYLSRVVGVILALMSVIIVFAASVVFGGDNGKWAPTALWFVGVFGVLGVILAINCGP